MHIEVVVANIVKQSDVDALVNSANANLRFGSGVAGAIHTAAGPELEEYCKRFAPIALGEAVVTPGFDLRNPYVIHARAASYINDEEPEKYLGLAVTNTLRVAQATGIKTLAMPAMGTGVFKFPPELAADIIMMALKRGAQEYPDVELVRICVVEERIGRLYELHVESCSSK